jgi:molybdopterin molybdotransferase
MRFRQQSARHHCAIHHTVQAIEKLAIRQALGRVLATDIVSGIDVPAHDNSAMDGYALNGSDLPATGVRDFRIVGTAFAGRPITATSVPENVCAS